MKIHIAKADDWAGLYVDGKLVYENHNLDAEDLLDLLKLPYTSDYFEDDLDQWGNRFPKTVEELEAGK